MQERECHTCKSVLEGRDEESKETLDQHKHCKKT